MDTIHLQTREAVLWITLINAGLGLILGLIPLLFGYFQKELKLGVTGFVVCIIGGAILGIFVSIPATIVFTALIWQRSNARGTNGPSE